MAGNPLVGSSQHNYGPTDQVYRFKKYDIVADEYRESARWATKYGIGRAGGVPLPHSHAPALQREIDDWDDGIAPKGWRPFRR
jgi:hypothetical protein